MLSRASRATPSSPSSEPSTRRTSTACTWWTGGGTRCASSPCQTSSESLSSRPDRASERHSCIPYSLVHIYLSLEWIAQRRAIKPRQHPGHTLWVLHAPDGRPAPFGLLQTASGRVLFCAPDSKVDEDSHSLLAWDLPSLPLARCHRLCGTWVRAPSLSLSLSTLGRNAQLTLHFLSMHCSSQKAHRNPCERERRHTGSRGPS